MVLLLIPLAMAPAWFFYFDVTPKIVVLLVGTAAGIIWWAVAGGRRISPWFSAAIAGMAISLVISTVVSVNRPLSLTGSNWRCWSLVTQLAVLGFAWLAAQQTPRAMFRAVAVGGLLTALYGIAQYFGFDPLLDARVYHVGEGKWTIVRPPSTLGHADYFGSWLLFVVFVGLALAGAKTSPAWKWLARLTVLLSSVAIILSGTRAALAGLIAGAVFLMVWRGLRVTRPMVTVMLTVIAAGAVFYISPAGAMLRARVHWVIEEPAGGARLLLWRDTLHMASERWLTGYGPETFTAAFARQASPELAHSYPDFYYESPHNFVLDVLASQGVPGVLLLLLFCAAGFLAAWKMRPEPRAAALAAGLAAMTIAGQFASFTMPTGLAWYVTVALLVSIASREPPAHGRRWLRISAAVPCAGLLLFFAVRLIVSETTLAAVRRDLNAGSISQAAAQYAAWTRGGPGADLWYSRRLALIAGGDAARGLRVEAFQNAVLAALRAAETDDAPFNANYNLAAIYASQNDYVRTADALRAAISCAPNWFKPHWMLARVLLAGGDLPGAEAEAAYAAALDAGKHAEVTDTLARIRAQRAAAKPVHK
jgi:O-antigen ligase